MRKLKMKLYVLLSVMVLCLTGCDTEEIKNQVSAGIENAIDENKDIIKDKVNDAIDNAVDSATGAIKDKVDETTGNIKDTIDGKLDEIQGSIGIEIPDEIKNIASKNQLKASAYDGKPYVTVNDNIPYFTDEEKQNLAAFETYSDLDSFGRCGVAYANVCKDLMPTDDRENISAVYPSGWNNEEYDFLDGRWVYNRSHIIGFQLTGENANEKNLITGTRYMNVQGMLPFENMVDDYVDETENHVLYRVTPVFSGNNLLCEGVLMEAWSVEDEGDGICFNIFCYNVQPGVEFDYATGENWEEGESVKPTETEKSETTYILNTNSKKFHKNTCANAENISNKNKDEFVGDRADLINQGYSPCGSCTP